MGQNYEKLWFGACIRNDIQSVKKYHKNFIRMQDTRDVQQQFYQGFTGLLYAVLNGAFDVVNFLFEYEYGIKTRPGVEICLQIPYQETKIQYFMAGSSSALQLAVLVGNYGIAQIIIDQLIDPKNEKLLMFKDDNNLQSIDLIIQQNSQLGFKFIQKNQRYYLQYELLNVTQQSFNTLFFSIAFGNNQIIKLFLGIMRVEQFVKPLGKLFTEIGDRIQSEHLQMMNELKQTYPVQMIASENLINKMIDEVLDMLDGQAYAFPKWVSLDQNNNQFNKQIRVSKLSLSTEGLSHSSSTQDLKTYVQSPLKLQQQQQADQVSDISSVVQSCPQTQHGEDDNLSSDFCILDQEVCLVIERRRIINKKDVQ